jgi:hypothetical protein
MWNEFEKFIRAHTNNSPNHRKVLECLLECRRPNEDSKISSPSPKKTTDNGRNLVIKEEKPDKSELEKSLQDFDKLEDFTFINVAEKFVKITN